MRHLKQNMNIRIHFIDVFRRSRSILFFFTVTIAVDTVFGPFPLNILFRDELLPRGSCSLRITSLRTVGLYSSDGGPLPVLKATGPLGSSVALFLVLGGLGDSRLFALSARDIHHLLMLNMCLSACLSTFPHFVGLVGQFWEAVVDTARSLLCHYGPGRKPRQFSSRELIRR